MRKLVLPALLISLAVAAPRTTAAQAPAETPTQTPAQTPAPSPEISADLGPCSALLTITDADSKPVYGAKITARVKYGAMAVKKLDLEAFTGPDGTLKLTHLPESLKKPMIIHIEKGDKGNQVEFNPAKQCEATFDVQLH